MLNPADVEQKTFSTALRGYDLDEVDDFLDEVVATIKQLTKQLEEARAGHLGFVATEATEDVPEPEPVKQPEASPEPRQVRADVDESAIGRALVAAQTTADKLVDDAKQEASRIVEGARTEAETMAEERDSKRREVEAEITALGARVASVRSELSALAGEVASKLDDMDAVLEGQDEDEVDMTPSVDDEDDTPAAPYLAIDVATDEELESDDVEEGIAEAEGLSAGDDLALGNSDHLDDILTGVANDLHLDSDVEPTNNNDSDEDEDPGEGTYT